MRQQKIITQKAFGITFSEFDALMDKLANGESGDVVGAYRIIGVANRCVKLRMNAAASVPFSLFRGDEQITTSDNWNDPTGGLTNPWRTFAKLEGALVIYGYGYLSKFTRDAFEPGLRYLLPTTVNFDGAEGSRMYFTRIEEKKPKKITDKDIVWIWDNDPTVEVAPPSTSPLYAALASAKVVNSFDEFMARFADSGMVKTTLLSVPEDVSENERVRIENIFQRLYTGVKKAFSVKVINAGAITPEVIGSGLDELDGGAMLTIQEERVARDLGVPLSLLFSNAANYATAQQDEKNFLSNTAVPDLTHVIGPAINEQWYKPRGYRIAFDPQSMDAFQEDEAQRSAAYANYISSYMRPSIAAKILGIDMPPGIEYEDLDGAPVAAPAQEQPQQQEQTEEPEEYDDEMMEEAKADLRRWRRMASKRYKEGKPEKALEFHSDTIPAWLQLSIVGAFEHCKGDDDTRTVFDLAEKALTIGEGDDGPDRDRYENELRRRMADIFAEYEDPSLEYVKGGDEPDYDALRAALFAALIAHYTRVASDRLFDLEAELQLDVDDGDAAAAISEWANATATERSVTLVETTRNVNGRARDAYEPDMSDDELMELLRAAFGDPRFDAIAIYETTEPLSAGVRIFQALIAVYGVMSLMVWMTMADERVCPVCGPLHEKRSSVWSEQFPFGPPAHGRCRCYLTLLVR